MKEFAKNIGVLVMLIGVVILTVTFMQGNQSNVILLIGVLTVIEGFLGHMFVNNLKDSKTGNIIWMVALLVIPYFIFYFAKKEAYGEELEELKK